MMGHHVKSICLLVCMMYSVVSASAPSVPARQIGRRAKSKYSKNVPTLQEPKSMEIHLEMLLTAMEVKSQRIAERAVDNEQVAALQARSSSADIYLSSPRGEYERQFAIGRQNNGITLVFITPTDVFINLEKYPIVGGKIFYQNVFYLVCGKGIARESAYICCSTKLFPKQLGPIACCHDVFIYTDQELCCGTLFYPQQINSRQVGCCVDNPFLQGEESCCNNEVVERASCNGGSTCTATSGRFCCNGQSVRNFLGRLQCCPGVGPYMPGVQTCCTTQIIRGSICP